jgi:macrodomain Ter protein organizer (MatP/YcbG family)
MWNFIKRTTKFNDLGLKIQQTKENRRRGHINSERIKTEKWEVDVKNRIRGQINCKMFNIKTRVNVDNRKKAERGSRQVESAVKSSASS